MIGRERVTDTARNREPVGSPVQGSPKIPDPVNTRQFDESRVFTFDFDGTNLRYGPFEVYTSPKGIGRAEILWLAVLGQPTFMFLTRVGWQLLIYEGGTQDFLPKSSDLNDPNNIINSGIRFTKYGSLDEPFPVKILLKSESRLDAVFIVNPSNIQVSPERPMPFTVYTRVSGLIFVRQVGT